MASPRLAVSQPDAGFVDGMVAALDSLRALTPNWDGYGGAAINPAVIDAAKSFIVKLADERAPRPRVVPMSDGTLQLEWHAGAKSLELEFESPSTIRYLKWHPDRRIEEENSFPISDIQTAVRLIRWFTAETGE
jgi:hypothetical protein